MSRSTASGARLRSRAALVSTATNTDSSTHLPDDPAELRTLVLAGRAALAARDEELNEVRAALAQRDQEIEALKLTLLKLRRLQFGRSSEKLAVEIEQLELRLEELESEGAIVEVSPVSRPSRQRPARRSLPAHLPRWKSLPLGVKPRLATTGAMTLFRSTVIKSKSVVIYSLSEYSETAPPPPRTAGMPAASSASDTNAAISCIDVLDVILVTSSRAQAACQYDEAVGVLESIS
jgi:hypothetical protein